jgi:hypothetical protein
MVGEMSNRYFGYMVAKDDGTHDVVVQSRAANADVMAEFGSLTTVITRIQPLIIAYAACETDYTSLMAWPADEEKRLRKTGLNVPISLVSDLMVETVRRVNAYLAAASSLIGQATIHVSANFGSDSDFGKSWHKLRQDLHASSLGYRLLYELRNYCQHYALPISEVRVTGRRDSDGVLSMNCGANVKRDALLNSGYEWRRRKNDLATLPGEFDLLPHAKDYQKCLRTLVVEIVRVNAEHLRVCIEYLNVVRRVLKAPPEARIWVFHGRGEAGRPPTSGLIVPEEQLQWIMRTVSIAADAA